MNPIVYAIPVFMASILLEIVIARWKRVPTYDIPDALTSLHFGTLSQTIGAFVKVLGFGLYVAVYERWHCIHRFGHEVNCLWAAHQVHHSSEYYNLSTALRQSSTGAVVGWPFYLVMAVAGVPPLVFGVVALIDLLYQYWVHTELVRKLGWFDRVFVSPSNHRVHHGQNDYCIDRNYGGILVVWDRLFGTFADERDGPITYGVRTPLRSVNPLWGNLHYYTVIWRDLRAARGLAAKLEALFAPPSGWQGEGLAGFDPVAFERHEVQVPPGLARYVGAQLVVSLLLACTFLYLFPRWEAWQGALAAAWMVAALAAPAGLMEGRRWGRWLEATRWIVALPVAWLLFL